MRYIDTFDNQNLIAYLDILSKDYPYFIDDYLKTAVMQNLNTKGQFCGSDYTALYSPLFRFTSLHHSIASALITWNFTKNKIQTIAALVHDIGTGAFRHCIDIYLKDSLNQTIGELPILEVIKSSKEFMALLKRDNINVEDIINLDKYSIVENSSPKLCADRLDGVLHTGYVWLCFWKLEDIKKIYNSIIVLDNENGSIELGFSSVESAELFAFGIHKYSIEQQKIENKFMLKFIADCIEILIDSKDTTLSQIYAASESEIINLIENNRKLKEAWSIFTNTSQVIKSNNVSSACYCVRNSTMPTKKRTVNPLVLINNEVKRLNDVSEYAKNLHKKFLIFEDKEFATMNFKL